MIADPHDNSTRLREAAAVTPQVLDRLRGDATTSMAAHYTTHDSWPLIHRLWLICVPPAHLIGRAFKKRPLEIFASRQDQAFDAPLQLKLLARSEGFEPPARPDS
jgi:hypothetical protein